MRVTRPHLGQSERGITIALFALFLTGLLGAAAFTVDLGHSWQERRNLITATDAAALAAAHDYAQGGNGCAGTAVSLLTQNFPNSTLDSCTTTVSGESGFVTVDGSANVDYIFGPAVGINNRDIGSTTSANWEPALTVGSGLRPFGICLDFLNEIGPPVEGDGIQYVIEYGRDDQSTVCGTDVPGNWSVLDFDGGSNPQGEINCWVEYGYGAPECAYGDEIVIDPVPYVEGNPGSFSNAMKNQMAALLNVECFILPIYTVANDLGGGNAEFNVVNFAGVRLLDYKMTGPQDDRFFTIEFVPCVTQGSGGGPGGFGAKVIGICAVDSTGTAGC